LKPVLALVVQASASFRWLPEMRGRAWQWLPWPRLPGCLSPRRIGRTVRRGKACSLSAC